MSSIKKNSFRLPDPPQDLSVKLKLNRGASTAP